jgi:hypothetical protein
MTVQTAGWGGFWNRASVFSNTNGAYQRLENPAMVPLYNSSWNGKYTPVRAIHLNRASINCVPRDEAALRRFKPEEQIAR